MPDSFESRAVEHGPVERGPVKSIARRRGVEEYGTNVTSASRLVEHGRSKHAAVERGPVMPASVESRVAVEHGPLGTQPITRGGGKIPPAERT
ncbi:hypothetical protein [Sphingomonas sp. Leaf230]|uniref:hypothetical protein n=1 Tax=Sphingomonas sp. Leaf230 TaxID=1735694 RepID=UPI0012E0E3E2|nr:hypothetical protein [Sphingomonas sp. Leaf230]